MRFVLAIVLLAGASLSGCMDAGGDASQDPADPSVSMPSEIRFDRVTAGYGMAEADVVFGPNEALVCAHGNFVEPSPLWASFDGGGSWAFVDPPTQAPPSGDCDMAVMDDGRWVIVYNVPPDVVVFYSDDDGASWEPAVLDGLPAAADRPNLITDGEFLGLSFAGLITAGVGVGYFLASEDGGATWGDSELMYRFEDRDRAQYTLGKGVVLDDGQVVVPVIAKRTFVDDNADGVGGPGTLRVAVRDREGVSWSTVDVVQSERAVQFWPTIADVDGSLFATMLDMDGRVNVHRSDDGGATWISWIEATANATFGTSLPIAPVAGDNGHVDVAWSQVDDGAYSLEWQRWSIGASTRVHAQTIEEGMNGPDGEFFSMRTAPGGASWLVASIDGGPECRNPPIQGGSRLECLYIWQEQTMS